MHLAAARAFRADRNRPDVASDPRARAAIRSSLLVGIALVLLIPMARGRSEWLGWLPLWLVGMPAVAWWALLGFRMPVLRMPPRAVRRRVYPQARRRRVAATSRLPRVA